MMIYEKKRRYLLLGSIALYLLIVFIPVSAYPQGLESPTSSLSSDNPADSESQKGDIEDFLTRYNGCSWIKTPYNPLCDITLELKDTMLILYRYLKDEGYCLIMSTVCFTNWELLRIRVKGYDMVLTDQKGNEYQVAISRDGQNITITGKDNLGFRENVLGTFVRFFCTGTGNPSQTP